jgi:hypothetical protein
LLLEFLKQSRAQATVPHEEKDIRHTRASIIRQTLRSASSSSRSTSRSTRWMPSNSANTSPRAMCRNSSARAKPSR